MERRSLARMHHLLPTNILHHAVAPKAARMDRLIAVPPRTMVKTTMEKAVNEIPMDLIHDLHRQMSMVGQATVPLTEIPILRILVVHNLLVPTIDGKKMT